MEKFLKKPDNNSATVSKVVPYFKLPQNFVNITSQWSIVAGYLFVTNNAIIASSN
jgi:hypothetical protein